MIPEYLTEMFLPQSNSSGIPSTGSTPPLHLPYIYMICSLASFRSVPPCTTLKYQFSDPARISILFSACSSCHLSPSLHILLISLFILCFLPSLKNVCSMNTGSFVLFTSTPRTMPRNQVFVENMNTYMNKNIMDA